MLLLDRADFPRDKSCGDGIAPHVLDALATVGATDAVAGWTPLRHLELARGDTRVAGPMRREVYVVPREVFDARLVEHAVAAGAVLQKRRVRRVEVRDDRVVLDGDLAARVVVGADGVHSVLRPHLLGDDREPPRHRDPRLRADGRGATGYPGHPLRPARPAGVRLGLRPR